MLFKKNKSYKEVLYEWLNDKGEGIKLSTYNKYLFQVENYIIPYLGSIKIKSLDKNHILNFYNHKNIEHLSVLTKNNLLIIINSSLKYATYKKYKRINERICVNFKKKERQISYFTKREQEIMEEYIKKHLNIRNLLILVALYTGARIGELCALKCSDIDFENKTITIDKTVQRVNNEKGSKLVLTRPKTDTSIRIIPAPEFIINILKNFVQNSDYFLFTNSNCPKDPRAAEKYFKNFVEKLSITPLHFHSLRHTFATRLRERKVDIKVISELLGHSDWRITQAVYVHASLDYKYDSVNELACDWD